MKKANPLSILTILVLFCIEVFIPICAQGEPSFQKGICYAVWQKERYLSAYSDKSLEMLAQTGAEWVEIVTTYYQQKFNSVKIFPTDKTPSDASIIHVINQAHQLGLKVMLKPHVDLIDNSDGLWRGDIGFQDEADWQAWFSQYRNFILHYANLAEKTDVELFCIGTELCFASTQTEFWQKDIIPRIKNAYSGKLIYAANWNEYKKISFWDDIDYVGIDAYFPLANKKNPEYEDIKAGCKKWASEITDWHKEINKPIIFTEIGYRSSEFSAAKPWDYNLDANIDLEVQVACYTAALDIFCNQSWCDGIYWWYWNTSPYSGGLNNRDFTPQGKPAEVVLNRWYTNNNFLFNHTEIR